MKNLIGKLFALLLSLCVFELDAQTNYSYPFQAPMPVGTIFDVGIDLPSGAHDLGSVVYFNFKINQSTTLVNTDFGIYEIELSIDAFDAQNNLVNHASTLELNYSPNGSTTFNDQDHLILNDTRKVEVEVTGISFNGTPLTVLPGNMILDVVMVDYSMFDLNPSSTISNVDITPIEVTCDQGTVVSDYLVTWPDVVGAKEYQLEWVFVNDYSDEADDYLTENFLRFNFKSNSTRVVTKATNYKIPHLFDHGYLLARVRAVGCNHSDTDLIYFTHWSGVQLGSLADFPPASIEHITIPHEANKNWQLTTTFAEEGKKKEVISYFDGSLRNRQTVTKINTDGNTIVGETIYDYQGRPVINVLPVPVGGEQFSDDSNNPTSIIKYYPIFNALDSIDDSEIVQVSLMPWHFDIDNETNECQPFGLSLSQEVGAANYYSPLNPNLNEEQAYIPVSNGFPYTQVEYLPDNTGRVKRQSGVGPEFSLGSDHETRYLYAVPAQIELDRLFGSEVGINTHYKKQMVKDPNGQMSVSYLDQEGRVIATALAGEAPSQSNQGENPNYSLLPLDGSSGANQTLTTNLLAGGSMTNYIDPVEGSITVSKTIAVGFESEYVFSYSLNALPFSDECMLENICFSCVYDLEVRLVDDCGNDLWTIGSVDGHSKIVGNVTVDQNNNLQFNMDCNASTVDGVGDLTVTLGIGEYNIYKKLTIRSDARTYYLNQYLSEAVNSCYIPYQTFLDNALAAIDPSECEVTCESCLESLGTVEDYIANGGTFEEWQNQQEACNDLCEEYNPCFEPYQMMLSDVSPSGQYCTYQEEVDQNGVLSTIVNGAVNSLSLLNENNQLSQNLIGDADWRHPKLEVDGEIILEYREDDNTRSKIYINLVDNGFYPPVVNVDLVFPQSTGVGFYTYPENLLNVKDFLNNWNDSWANSLISYHPEYCYYKACLDVYFKEGENEWTSARLDELIDKSNTIQDAEENGLLTMTIQGTDIITSYDVLDWTTSASTATEPRDEFILNSSYYLNFGLDLKQKWDTYLTLDGVSYSMPQIAALIQRTGNNFGPGATVEPWMIDYGNPIVGLTQIENSELLQAEWSTLQSLYLSTKRQIIYQYFDFKAIACDDCFCFNDCIGKTEWYPYTTVPDFAFNDSNTDYAYYFTPNEQCGFTLKSLYASKIPRWVQATDIPSVAIASDLDQNTLNYNLYAETGLCPVDFAFQNLLTQVATEDNLDNTGGIELLDYTNFAGLIYAMQDNYASESISNYDWEWRALTTGNTLNIQITDISEQTEICEITLQQNVGFSWDDVIEFRELTVTDNSGTTDLFIIQVKVYNSVTDENVWYDISGSSSCFNLGVCHFENECQPTALALQIQALMNGLQSQHASGVDVDGYMIPTELYSDLGLTMMNYLGQPADVMWTFDDINLVFKIGGINGISLMIDEVIPSNYNLSQISQADYFNNITSLFENYYSIEVWQNGVIVATLKGRAYHNVGGVDSPLNLGECGPPQLFSCLGAPFEAYEDMENWVMDIIFKENEDAFANINFNETLEGYFSNEVNTGFPSLYSTVDSVYFEIVEDGCSLILSARNIWGFTFNSLLTATNFQLAGEADDQGAYHHFTIDATFTSSSGFERPLTIYGRTCIGMQLCELECEDGELDDDGVEETEDDGTPQFPKSLQKYYEYSDAVDAFNEKYNLQESDSLFIEKMSYAFFFELGSYYSVEQYAIKLAAFKVGVDVMSSLKNLVEFSRSYGNYVNPKEEWLRYANAVSKYNQRALEDSLPALEMISDSLFYYSSLSDSLDLYLNYLEVVNNIYFPPVALDDFYEWLVQDYSVPETCEEMYQDYVDAYHVWEANQQLQGGCDGFVPGKADLHTKETFLKAGFCNDSIGYIVFEDYINLLLDESNCVNSLPSVEKSARAESLEVDERECQEDFNEYIRLIKDYNFLIDANNSSLELLKGFKYFQIFLDGGWCNCVKAYNIYLSGLITQFKQGNAIQAIPIELWDGCDTKGEVWAENPCDTAFKYYLNTVVAFNNYLLSMRIREWELPIEMGEKEFNEGGYCYCMTEWVAYLNAFMDREETKMPLGDESILLVDFCKNDPPCNPETSLLEDMADWPEVPYTDPCLQGQINNATSNAQVQFGQYLSELTQSFIERYNDHCLNVSEVFTETHEDKEYHYTLYYYDQAGNLIKTVPPAGVRRLNMTVEGQGLSLQVENDRRLNQHTVFTSHQMETKYVYNSLNQLIRQDLPDHEKMTISDFTLPSGLPASLVPVSTHLGESNIGWLVGNMQNGTDEYGVVYKTNDGGNSWTRVNNLIGADLNATAWANESEQIAVSVGNAGTILRTTNGGSTWHQIDNHLLTYSDLNHIAVDEISGQMIIVGDNKTILSSSDNGLTWSVYGLPLNNPIPADVDFSMVMFVNSVLYITADYSTSTGNYSEVYVLDQSGGGSITKVPVFTKDLNDIAATDYNTMMISGKDGQLYELSWTSQGLVNKLIESNSSLNLKQTYFKSASNGLVIAQNGSESKINLLTTSNGLVESDFSDANWKSLKPIHNTNAPVPNLLAVTSQNELMRLIFDDGIDGIPVPSPNIAGDIHSYAADRVGGDGAVVVCQGDNLFLTRQINSLNPEWLFLSNISIPAKDMVITENTNDWIKGLLLKTNGELVPFTINPTNNISLGTPVNGVAALTINYSANIAYVLKTNAAVEAWSLTFSNTSMPTTFDNHTTTLTGITGVPIDLSFNAGKLVVIFSQGEIVSYTLNAQGAITADVNVSSSIGLSKLNASSKQANKQFFAGNDGNTYIFQSESLHKVNNGETLDITAMDGTTNSLFIGTENGKLIRHSYTTNDLVQIRLNIPFSNQLNERIQSLAIVSDGVYLSGIQGSLWRGNLNNGNASAPLLLALTNPGVPKNHLSKRNNGEVLSTNGNGSFHKIIGTTQAPVYNIFSKKLKDVHFNEGIIGGIVGENGFIRVTYNGGQNWTPIIPQLPTQFDDIYAVHIAEDNRIKLAGNKSLLARVENGFATTEGSTGTDTYFDLISFSTNNVSRFIAVGNTSANASLYKTTNTSSWSNITGIPAWSDFRVQAVTNTPRSGTIALAGINISNEVNVKILNLSNATLLNHMTYTCNTMSDVKGIAFIDDLSFIMVGGDGQIAKGEISGVTDLNIPQINYSGTSASFVMNQEMHNPLALGQIGFNQFQLVDIAFLGNGKFFLAADYTGANRNGCRILKDLSNKFSTLFWYDHLGRIVASQNSKQKVQNQYSYTRYDALGRVLEAGVKSENSTLPFESIFGSFIGEHFNPNTVSYSSFEAWVAGDGVRKEVTRTIYDQEVTTAGLDIPPYFTQDHLRKRVSAVVYQEEYVASFENGMDQNYVHATYYSYDIHGNVKTLIQNFPSMTIDGDYQNMRFKRFDYNYDLISGNVHDVYYQLGQPDAWHHHYEYDADNRIIEVYTSKKEVPMIDPRHSITWDNDANYFYYDHGPLARVEIGDNQVQGVDYAYTLQGWLKGVNSNALNANLDMGKDAAASNSPNSLFAKDVFSFSLGYYNGDYEAAGGIAANNWLSDASGNSTISGAHDLWNGNIGVMMTNVIKPAGTTYTGTSNEGLMAGVYQYDQLNRLVSASFVDDFNEATNSWGSNGATDKYKNEFTYDANGNILTQKRRGESGQMVDDLVYHYHSTNGQIVQNRLYSVDDLSGVSGDGDMSDMPTFNNSSSDVNELNNYTYTEIGELKSDAAEEISEIIWRVDSKIREIIRTSSSVKENLKFEYDAMGNRIAKHVYDELGVLQHSTFYVRDAQGNVMAVYEQEVTAPEGEGPPVTPSITYHLTERHIYGSARLGMDRTMVEMAPTLIQAYPLEPTIPVTEESERYLGRKYYELSNHLGNVLTVITDEKRMILDGNNYSHYASVVVSVTDYSPFGVSLTGRTFTTTEGYRYGFNGKEEDKEFELMDYGFRFYDSRLGRFVQVDPLHSDYPYWSSYQFAGNLVIIATDLDGAEPDLQIESYPEPIRRVDWDWVGEVYGKAFYYKVHQQGKTWHVAKYERSDMSVHWFYWSNPSSTNSAEGKWISDAWRPQGAPDMSVGAGGLIPITPDIPQDWTGFYKNMSNIRQLYDNGAKFMIATTFIFCGAGVIAEIGLATSLSFGTGSSAYWTGKILKCAVSITSQAVTGEVDFVDVASDTFINNSLFSALVNAGFDVKYDLGKSEVTIKGPVSKDRNFDEILINTANGAFWNAVGGQITSSLAPILQNTGEEILIELSINLPAQCSSQGVQKTIENSTQQPEQKKE